MFTRNKTLRAAGWAGMASALALIEGCAARTVDPSCGELEGAGCVRDRESSVQPMPPAGYTAKWSTCTNFVEGDAKIRNNSRIVTIRSDGTVPIQRVEPTGSPADDVRRVLVSKLTNKVLLRGEGVLRKGSRLPAGELGSPGLTLAPTGPLADAPSKVSFVKLGQIVDAREADGSVVQWTISSEALGEPIVNRTSGRLEYQDTCFRNPNLVGKDTAGYIDEAIELAGTCVVEDMGQAYNALSATGSYVPLLNYVTTKVPTANDPHIRPHPDNLATYLGYDLGIFLYTGVGAALNDINGAERDGTTLYFGGYDNCHMIVSNGLEVPGAKRPATKSLPFPGVVNGNSYDLWRPVNPNVIIANDQEPVAPHPIEPAPQPAEAPIDANDAIVPM